MPEYLIAIMITTFVGIGAGAYKSYTDLEQRVDRIELTVAKDYVDRTELHERLEGVHARISRLENSLTCKKNNDRNPWR